MDPMLGMIFLLPFSWAPNGYQSCQGQTLNIQQYEALYSLMGIAYGGNGSTNFMLPDLQTRTAYGQGTANNVTYAISNNAARNQVGSGTATLSQLNLPAHTHTAVFVPTGGGTGTPMAVSVTVDPITVNVPALPVTIKAAPNAASTTTALTSGSALSASLASTATSAAIWTPGGTPTVPLANGTATSSATAVTANATASATVTGGGGGITGGTVTNGMTGASQPFATVSPGVVLNYVIAVMGLYPDRP